MLWVVVQKQLLNGKNRFLIGNIVKQKYAEIKTHRNKTGRGPAFYKNLTPQEERLIRLSSMEGDGVVEEIGLPRQAEIVENPEAGPSSSSHHLITEESKVMFVSETSPGPIEIILPSQTASLPTSRHHLVEPQKQLPGHQHLHS